MGQADLKRGGAGSRATGAGEVGPLSSGECNVQWRTECCGRFCYPLTKIECCSGPSMSSMQ